MSGANANHTGKTRLSDFGQWIVSVILIGIFRLLRLIPYRWRVPFGGALLSRVIAPLIGYRGRVRANLDLIFPELGRADRDRLTRASLDNIGRTITELFSPRDFPKVAADAPVSGPGLNAIEAARQAGQPIVLISGHFGNYDAWRSGLIGKGYNIGGLYRRMNFDRFNAFYVDSITQIGSPLFLRGRRGLAEMVRHLRGGNAVGLLIDQHMKDGEVLDFMGQPAATALSAAEMAVKYDALLVPLYAIRQPDGLSFEITVEEPIPHGPPAEMMTAANRSLEDQIRAHPEQWLWTHRRWKRAGLGS